MRQNKLLLFYILLIATLGITTAYAGGPGFDKDVYNWEQTNEQDDDVYNYGNDDDYQGGHDDDDDYHGGHDDDDDYHGGHGDDDDDHGGWGDDDDDGNEVPLDGGLSFLALAGAGLGIKKARDSMAKNKQKQKEQ